MTSDTSSEKLRTPFVCSSYRLFRSIFERKDRVKILILVDLASGQFIFVLEMEADMVDTVSGGGGGEMEVEEEEEEEMDQSLANQTFEITSFTEDGAVSMGVIEYDEDGEMSYSAE